MQQAHLYELKRTGPGRRLWVSVAASAALFAAFLLSLALVKTRQSARETEQLETAIRRACVTCYAVEGRYPKSLAYIVEHYGVTVDADAFVVRYDAYAENLMPDIHVTRKGGAP